MALQLDHLDLLTAPAGLMDGLPMQLPLDLIDEDPTQPRQEFDEGALRELAETIRERGVRQPVSVREHPEAPGRWMLNFGARRLRASRLAGREQIPAFIDSAADSYDQVIENEQRQGLTPMELAMFVQRRMAEGEYQAEIARRLGKSRAYITMVCALIDAPDWLMDAYRSGQCRGIKALYDLRTMHEQRPAEVQALLQSGKQVTRTVAGNARRSQTTHGELAAELVTAGNGTTIDCAALGQRAEEHVSAIEVILVELRHGGSSSVPIIKSIRGRVEGLLAK